MKWNFLAILLTATTLSLILTPVMIRLAKWMGAIDEPNKRKVHTQCTPRLGGLGIYLSVIATFVLMTQLVPEMREILMGESDANLIIGAALTLVVILGVCDDIHPLGVSTKFLVQVGIASWLYVSGVNISNLTELFDTGYIDTSYLAYPLTVLWIIGVTNAFNLIDGLDGLASGVTLISCATIFTISMLEGNLHTAALVIMLAGAVLGFLYYNFNPASIFLGDSGSLFLGFALAIISMQSYTKASTALSLAVPVMVLGFPIMDTLIAMLRRFLRPFMSHGKENEREEEQRGRLLGALKRMFRPDKSHIHHQLMERGFSQKMAVLLLYLISGLYGIGAVVIYNYNTLGITLLVLGITGLLAYMGLKLLKYREIALLENGIFLDLYRNVVLKWSILQRVFDLIFVLSSGWLTFEIMEFTFGWNSESFIGFSVLLIITGVQYSLLWLSGLYSNTIRRLGIGNVIGMLKSIGLAVLTTGVGLLAFSEVSGEEFMLFFVLDFYFLITMVLGIRIMFHILQYVYIANRDGKKRVLIYGANDDGVMALWKILNNHSDNLKPIGFLDDDADMAGKYINEYRIFGTHWQLKKLIRERNIDEILLTDEDIRPLNLKRIKKTAARNDINVKKMDLRFTDLTDIRTSNTHSRESKNGVPADLPK